MGGGDPSTSAKVWGEGYPTTSAKVGWEGYTITSGKVGGGRGTLVLRVRSGGRGTRRLLTSLLLRLGATRTRGGAGTSTAEGQDEDAEGTGEGARALPPSHSSPPNHPTRALRTLLQPSWMRVDESWTNSHPTHPTLIKRSPNSSPPFVERPPSNSHQTLGPSLRQNSRSTRHYRSKLREISPRPRARPDASQQVRPRGGGEISRRFDLW